MAQSENICECCLRVFIWSPETPIFHKMQILSVPLTENQYPHQFIVRQMDPIYPPTQSHLQLGAILSIARASLGGFFIPEDIASIPRSANDKLTRYSFHEYDPAAQTPGHQLSSTELLQPLTDLANASGAKEYWIKTVEQPGGCSQLPTKNVLPLTLALMKGDVGKRSKKFAACVKNIYRDEQTCPFTNCFAPEACHIYERSHGNSPLELIIKFTNAVKNNLTRSYPSLDISPDGRPRGFLDPGFPTPNIDVEDRDWSESGLKDIVDMPANGMMLASDIHEGYDRYRWCFYLDRVFWIQGEGCPLFESYGWAPQFIAKKLKFPHLVGRRPLEIPQHTDRAALQSVRTIVGFMHRFGTSMFREAMSDLLAEPKTNTDRQEKDEEGEEEERQHDTDKQTRGRGRGRNHSKRKRSSNDDGFASGKDKGQSDANDDIGAAGPIPASTSSGSDGSGVMASSSSGSTAATSELTAPATAETSHLTIVGSGTLEEAENNKVFLVHEIPVLQLEEAVTIYPEVGLRDSAIPRSTSNMAAVASTATAETSLVREIPVPQPEEAASSALKYDPAAHPLIDSDDVDDEEMQEQVEQCRETERLILLWILNCWYLQAGSPSMVEPDADTVTV